MTRFRLLMITALLAIIVQMGAQSALAGASYQSVEYQQYGSGTKYGFVSAGLTRGCKPDQPTNWDYKYYFAATGANSDRLRLSSNDSKAKSVFSGRSPMGANLNSSYPYICIGISDAWAIGGPIEVPRKLYVWVS